MFLVGIDIYQINPDYFAANLSQFLDLDSEDNKKSIYEKILEQYIKKNQIEWSRGLLVFNYIIFKTLKRLEYLYPVIIDPGKDLI